MRNGRRPLNLLRLVPAKGVTMSSATTPKTGFNVHYRTIDLVTITTLAVDGRVVGCGLWFVACPEGVRGSGFGVRESLFPTTIASDLP